MVLPTSLTSMSGSEVLGCVDLVVRSFSEAAVLVGKLSRKQKRRKGERDYHELLLFQVLEHGAHQIRRAYDDGFARFGTAFRIGDDQARERLLCIAIETNTDLVQALALASELDKATVDLVYLHESAITTRHDAIRTINDLYARLDKLRPIPAFSRFSPDSSLCGGYDTRRNSTLLNPQDLALLPGPDTAPPPMPPKSGLRRILSVGRPGPGPGPGHQRRTNSDDLGALRPATSQGNPAFTPGPLYINNRPAYPRIQHDLTPPRPAPLPPAARPSRPCADSNISSSPHAVVIEANTTADVTADAGTKDREPIIYRPDSPTLSSSHETEVRHKRHFSSTSKSSKTSRRDSAFSNPTRASCEPVTPTPSRYPAVLPPPPPVPIQRPSSPTVYSSLNIHQNAMVISPITEVEADNASVSAADYDAASSYSQDDPSPVSPTSSSSSHERDSYNSTSSVSDPDTPLTDRTSLVPKTSQLLFPTIVNPNDDDKHDETSPRSSSCAASTAPSTAPSLKSPPSQASTTISALERQMYRADDVDSQPISALPQVPFHSFPIKSPDRQAAKQVKKQASKSFLARMADREKAKDAGKGAVRKYVPLSSAAVVGGCGGGAGVGIADNLILGPAAGAAKQTAAVLAEAGKEGGSARAERRAGSVGELGRERVGPKKFWHLRKVSKGRKEEEEEEVMAVVVVGGAVMV